MIHDMIKIMWYKNLTTASSYYVKNTKNKILVQLNVGRNNGLYYNLRKFSVFQRSSHNIYFGLKYGKFLCQYREVYLKYDTLPITDVATGQIFADLIAEDLAKNASFVINVLPDEGHLVKALLDRNISNIYTFEYPDELSPNMRLLQAKYHGRLHCIDISFNALSEYLSGKEVYCSEDLRAVAKTLPTAKWSDPSPIQMVGIGKSGLFLNHVLLPTIFKSKFMSLGRVCFYLAIGPVLWKTLCGDRSNFFFYRSNSVLFQLFFNSHIFGSIMDEKFRKKFKTKSYDRTYRNKDKTHGVQIVKIEPKPDLYEIVTQEQLFAFWYFLRCLMSRRTNRIIPIMETWIPGCGPTLISLNCTMYTYAGDLTPQELLNLFLQFQSWPEYKTSTFYERLAQLRGLCSGIL